MNGFANQPVERSSGTDTPDRAETTDLAETVAYLLGTSHELAAGLVGALRPMCPLDRVSLQIVTGMINDAVSRPPAPDALVS